MSRLKSKPMDMLELLAAAAKFQQLPQSGKDEIMKLLKDGGAA